MRCCSIIILCTCTVRPLARDLETKQTSAAQIPANRLVDSVITRAFAASSKPPFLANADRTTVGKLGPVFEHSAGPSRRSSRAMTLDAVACEDCRDCGEMLASSARLAARPCRQLSTAAKPPSGPPERGTGGEPAAPTAKRDLLVGIQEKMQKRWAESGIHEADPPPADDRSKTEGELQKYFVTFPYPYMNGRLHLGHGFSFSKAEFAARYQRLKGKRVLWPFGLHVTGTPIAACAKKLQNEMDQYGSPPVFPAEVLDSKPAESKTDPVAPGQHKGKRSKIGPAKPQWLIMEQMGIPPTDIPKFAEATHWLKHFPPLALEDMKKIGAHIDYRRSFITTEVNPFYDAFIRWQFRNLQEQNLLAFGKRYCVYSPLDGQPCADHDRASGEGVAPMEYTIVKLRVQSPENVTGLAPFLEHFREKKGVFLPGATLRAETVIGQTNCWISPLIDYQAFEIKSEGSEPSSIFLMTSKAARNMAHQDIDVDSASPLFSLKGQDLVGVPLSAPYAPFETIYTLPMESITESKGTGVVMSVPSDSPADYINQKQLLEKPDYRKKLGIADHWVLPFGGPLSIIQIPNSDLGNSSAEVACAQLKIKSPKELDLLEEAKKVVYNAAFYDGVMTAGPFAGKTVQEAKVNMAKRMFQEGVAMKYYEPAKPVVSRSGDDCVVALTEQWFLRYGEEAWRDSVAMHVNSSMELFNPSIRNCIHETLNWLSEWPCSRNFGLGTTMPSHSDPDARVIIDSLSDSTIYMAYYTIAKYLHTTKDGRHCLDAREPNKYGITPEMMQGDAPWDYILRGQGSAEDVFQKTGLPIAICEQMREEFVYFYPVDLRVSGKDLIPNHLTMFLYNHAAIWKNDTSKWPRGIFCNGHTQIDGAKMSKSAGNFVLLKDAIADYSADATRLALADSGDSLDDANFVRENAKGFILKLTAFIEFVKSRFGHLRKMRTGNMTLFDSIFDNALNRAIIEADRQYERMCFKQVLNTVFFELQQDEMQYELQCGASPENFHATLMERYLESAILLLMPLAPHTAEYLWQDVLGKPKAVVHELFPRPTTAMIDIKMFFAQKLISDVIRDIAREATRWKAKKKEFEEVVVYVAQSYADWQKGALKELLAIFQESPTGEMSKDVGKDIISKKPAWVDVKKMQEIMAFISFARSNAEKYHSAEALHPIPVIDDKAILSEACAFISAQTGGANLTLRSIDDEATTDEDAAVRGKTRPGQPQVAFKASRV